MINFSFKLPYPLLASLNGVALFAQSQDVTLLTTLTKDCKLLWRDYQNRYIITEGTKTNGDQRSQRRPTVAVGNCSPFAIGKEYNIYYFL